jgi:hypothetical protein
MKFICLFLFFLLFVSCGSSGGNENNEITDDEKGFCETLDVEINENGSEECPFPGWNSIVQTGFYADYESEQIYEKTGLPVVIEDAVISEGVLRLKARSDIEKGPNGEDLWRVFFSGYDFTDFDLISLIGRQWRLFYVDSRYYPVNAEIRALSKQLPATSEMIFIKEESGNLVALSASGIESGDKIWPSDLIPDITTEVLHPENCVPFECRENVHGYSGDVLIDVLVAPPVKFSRNGKSVIVRNGEKKEMEGYIYTISMNTKIHEKDPDNMFFDVAGKQYQYDFQILNTEAFK